MESTWSEKSRMTEGKMRRSVPYGGPARVLSLCPGMSEAIFKNDLREVSAFLTGRASLG